MPSPWRSSGFEDAWTKELVESSKERASTSSADDIEDLDERSGVDAIVIASTPPAPLELLGALEGSRPRRRRARRHRSGPTRPTARLPSTAAPRTTSCAARSRRTAPPGGPLRGRPAAAPARTRRTSDELTGLPNLRGFAPIAEHHLRMADRAKTPVVFLFVRLDGLAATRERRRPEEAGAWCERRPRCSSRPSATRTCLPASPTTRSPCCLTGDAAGAETLVLSRLVEAIAVHDAARRRRGPLALGRAAPSTTPSRPRRSPQILETADRRLREATGTEVIRGHMSREYPETERPFRDDRRKGRGCDRRTIVAGRDRAVGDDRHLRGARPRPAPAPPSTATKRRSAACSRGTRPRRRPRAAGRPAVAPGGGDRAGSVHGGLEEPGGLRRRAGLGEVVAHGHGPSPRRRPGPPRGVLPPPRRRFDPPGDGGPGRSRRRGGRAAGPAGGTTHRPRARSTSCLPSNERC